jgi:hypothetical protein
VLWICFNTYPEPAFYLNADPDSGTQTNADPDAGQILPKQKVEYMINTGYLIDHKHTDVGEKAFFKGWKSHLFFNLGQFPCSWIRSQISIPNTNTDPDTDSQINADPDPHHCF